MIIRGRSIYANSSTAGNLTRYLLHNPKNERAVFLGASGTAFSDDLEKSIQQMIWAAEDCKSQKPLYFAALSPDLAVDKTTTEEQWEQYRLAQAKRLGLENQPYAWVEHEKFGENGEPRIHRHVIYQRYDAVENCLISDRFDRRNNRLACADIEQEHGHDRTFQRWTKAEIDKMRQRQTAKEFLQSANDIQVAEHDPVARMEEIHELQKQQQLTEPDPEDDLYQKLLNQYKQKGHRY